MLSELVVKCTINKYVKKYNNKQLRDTYLSLKKKYNKTHIDFIFIKICAREMKKRGILFYGSSHSKN